VESQRCNCGVSWNRSSRGPRKFLLLSIDNKLPVNERYNVVFSHDGITT